MLNINTFEITITKYQTDKTENNSRLFPYSVGNLYVGTDNLFRITYAHTYIRTHLIKKILRAVGWRVETDETNFFLTYAHTERHTPA